MKGWMSWSSTTQNTGNFMVSSCFNPVPYEIPPMTGHPKTQELQFSKPECFLDVFLGWYLIVGNRDYDFRVFFLNATSKSFKDGDLQ
jgi:hypothetical protein